MFVWKITARNLLAALVCFAAVAHVLPTLAQASPSTAQMHYLALAKSGVASAESHWQDRRLHWYDERLSDHERYPLATIWGIVPLFQSLDAIAIAQPNAANRSAVERFASGAERYLNKGLRPLAGYSPYPGDREADTETWFDDNGWWGLGFLNAYQASGRRRYLADAQRALRYIAAAGWDADGGGMWWNTAHPYKSGPALASDTLLATLLFERTHSAFAREQAERFMAWANNDGFLPSEGLYEQSSIDPTPVDYVQSPLIYAEALLCRLINMPDECQRVEEIKETVLERFRYPLQFAPQYDAIYLQWMLALYGLDHDPALYELAAREAQAAARNARDSEGLYLRSWSGAPLPAQDGEPGMLRTQAATTSLFAWLAVYAPPPSGPAPAHTD
ncbi:MAG: glycoside hydrolase family 76 protein [Solirubrobacteraceae bacterium]